MQKFVLIAGPCAIESKEICSVVAKEVSQLCKDLDITYIFKASYSKANRTSINSFSGLEFADAMDILRYVKETYDIKILTDIHESQDAERVAPFVDYLQIPAFLARQTALLLAAGRTGKGVNIKKGQFMSPESMKFAVEKVRSTGNQNIFLTERGTMFGYNDLVVDFKSIPTMQQIGVPVILDATHCLQKPNQSSGVTAGNPEFISLMAGLGISAGADGLFMEVHPTPEASLSDRDTILDLKKLPKILEKCVALKKTVSKF